MIAWVIGPKVCQMAFEQAKNAFWPFLNCFSMFFFHEYKKCTNTSLLRMSRIQCGLSFLVDSTFSIDQG